MIKLEKTIVHELDGTEIESYSTVVNNIWFIKMGEVGIQFENKGNPNYQSDGILFCKENTKDSFIKRIEEFFNPVEEKPNPRKLILEINVDSDYAIDYLQRTLGNALGYATVVEKGDYHFRVVKRENDKKE